MEQITLTFVAALFAANLWHIKGMPKSKKINQIRAIKINKGVFYSALLIVIVVLCSCNSKPKVTHVDLGNIEGNDSVNITMDGNGVKIDSFTSKVNGCPIYYNGEGEEIPVKAVELLVNSQYIKINDAERKYLDSIFYAKKH